MATIRDVAALARVSVGTVSRVLNEHPSVRPPVREAVMAAIAELGYQPNTIARSLRSARTSTIGLLLHDLRNPITVSFLRAVEDAAAAAQYTVLIAESRGDPAVEREHLQSLIDRRVDGLLCSPVRSGRAVHTLASAAGVPVVLVHQRAPHPTVPTAFVDEADALHTALEHLVSLGHRRIATVHVGTQAAGRPRREFVERFLHARIPMEPSRDLHRSFLDDEECAKAVREVLLGPERATALIVGAHNYAADALVAIRDVGYRVPDDVSLIAFGDSRWAEAVTPPISVISADADTHAADAINLLTRMISGDENMPRSVGLASAYIPRQSCGPAPEAGSSG